MKTSKTATLMHYAWLMFLPHRMTLRQAFSVHLLEKFPERQLQPDDIMPPPVLL